MSEPQYVLTKTCERMHAEDDARWKRVFASLTELNDRLYKDNGHVSIQTRLDRGDRILAILCWVATLAGGTVVVAGVAFVWKTVIHVGL